MNFVGFVKDRGQHTELTRGGLSIFFKGHLEKGGGN